MVRNHKIGTVPQIIRVVTDVARPTLELIN